LFKLTIHKQSPFFYHVPLSLSFKYVKRVGKSPEKFTSFAVRWRRRGALHVPRTPATAFRCCVSAIICYHDSLPLSAYIGYLSFLQRWVVAGARTEGEKKKFKFEGGTGSSPRSRRSAPIPSHDGGIHPREERSRTRNDAPSAVTLVRGRRVVARTCPGEGIACREGSSRSHPNLFRYAAPVEVKQLGRGSPSAPLLEQQPRTIAPEALHPPQARYRCPPHTSE